MDQVEPMQLEKPSMLQNELGRQDPNQGHETPRHNPKRLQNLTILSNFENFEMQ